MAENSNESTIGILSRLATGGDSNPDVGTPAPVDPEPDKLENVLGLGQKLEHCLTSGNDKDATPQS